MRPEDLTYSACVARRAALALGVAVIALALASPAAFCAAPRGDVPALDLAATDSASGGSFEVAQAAAPAPADNNTLGAESLGQVETDPLAPFNTRMFTFNLKLDQYVLRPVAKGYSFVMPEAGRRAVGRFFNNVNFIPRFANNLFQLHFVPAGEEVARFGINSTLGLAGLFDPADKWFGLREHPDDFGLTLRYYGTHPGDYLMLPFFGPSTTTDTVGLVVDGALNPLSYLTYYSSTPTWVVYTALIGSRVVQAVNYRSLHLNQFEEADRYAIDLYGAVQDAYVQSRTGALTALKDRQPAAATPSPAPASH